MHQDVDVLPVEDERVVLEEGFEFEIPCEGPIIWPERIGEHDAPAKWIGLKTCGHHRLFCQQCKDGYLDLMAEDPIFTCRECGDKGRTFIGFELINRARM
jgi:hypothetical protein